MNIIRIYGVDRDWKAVIGDDETNEIAGYADHPVRALQDLVFRLNITPWKFEEGLKMKCINSECHSYQPDSGCSMPQHFIGRPCYERILPEEPQETLEE